MYTAPSADALFMYGIVSIPVSRVSPVTSDGRMRHGFSNWPNQVLLPFTQASSKAKLVKEAFQGLISVKDTLLVDRCR